MTDTGVVTATMATPLGELRMVASDQGLRQLHLPPHDGGPAQVAGHPVLRAVQEQLAAYFGGELTEFDLPLDPVGTPYQQRVWRLLCTIPYGTTTSYGALAAQLGAPGASRAVGAANGRNPIAIVVPCHRVIASDGALRGYAGGLATKRWLLAHELQSTSPRVGTLF